MYSDNADYEFDEPPISAGDYGLFSKKPKNKKDCGEKAEDKNDGKGLLGKKIGYTCKAKGGAKKCDASKGEGVKQEWCDWKSGKCKCTKKFCRPTKKAPPKVCITHSCPKHVVIEKKVQVNLIKKLNTVVTR